MSKLILYTVCSGNLIGALRTNMPTIRESLVKSKVFRIWKQGHGSVSRGLNPNHTCMGGSPIEFSRIYFAVDKVSIEVKASERCVGVGFQPLV